MKGKIWHVPFIVVICLLVIAIAGFVWFYIQTSNAYAALESQLSSTNSELESSQRQNTDYNSQISTLQGQVTSGGSQLSTLQGQISSLQSDVARYISQAASLTNQLASANSEVTSLQGQLSSANSQYASLQSRNNDLQSITKLSKSTVVANQRTINQSAGQSSTIVSFNADYAGYIVVSGTSTTSNGTVIVTYSFPNLPATSPHTFGTSSTLTIPVLPGTVTVSFNNSNLLNGATATITVTYFY